MSVHDYVSMTLALLAAVFAVGSVRYAFQAHKARRAAESARQRADEALQRVRRH